MTPPGAEAAPGAPAVTVVIPVWDAYVDLLPEAVASVRRQGGGVRIVVVDNASRRPLPATAPDVTVVRLGHRATLGGSRNAALPLIETPYALFLDADDALEPGAVELLLGRMRSRAELVACSGRRLFRNRETGTVTPSPWPGPEVHERVRRPRRFALRALLGQQLLTVGALLRTDTLRDCGGWGDLDRNEDWSLLVALAFRGPIEVVDRATFASTVHLGGLGQRRVARSELARDCHAVRRRAWCDPSVPPAVKLALPLVALLQARRVRRQTPRGYVAFDELPVALGGRELR